MTIKERLEAMEKELNDWKRYSRRLVACAVLIVAGALIWGFGFMGNSAHGKAEKEIRAQSFVVVDEEGKERAILGTGIIPRAGFNLTHEDPAWVFRGHPHLAMLDHQGEPRAILGTWGVRGSATLKMTGGKEKHTVRNGLYLTVDNEGLPMLEMVYNNMAMAKIMLTSPNGEPLLRTYGEQGKTTWQAP